MRMLVLVALATACGDGGARTPREMGTAEVGAESGGVTASGQRDRIVSTVDGQPITVGDVEALVRAGMNPRQALDQAQERELLAAEARRRGYVDDRVVRRRVAQTAAQTALVRLVEERVTTATISDADVQEYYDAQAERWLAPERRATRHLLVAVEPDASPVDVAAARALAARAHAALTASSDPGGTLSEWMTTGEFEGHAVRIEDVPAVSEHEEGWAPEYLQAVYRHDGLGLLDGVVRTHDFGFHTIVVTEVVPARDVAVGAAADEIRGEIVVRRRAEALVELLEQLAREIGVETHDAVVQNVLSQDLFDETGGS